MLHDSLHPVKGYQAATAGFSRRKLCKWVLIGIAMLDVVGLCAGLGACD